MKSHDFALSFRTCPCCGRTVASHQQMLTALAPTVIVLLSQCKATWNSGSSMVYSGLSLREGPWMTETESGASQSWAGKRSKLAAQPLSTFISSDRSKRAVNVEDSEQERNWKAHWQWQYIKIQRGLLYRVAHYARKGNAPLSIIVLFRRRPTRLQHPL